VGDTSVSADTFIGHVLRFFGGPDPTARTPHERGARLAGLSAVEDSLLV